MKRRWSGILMLIVIVSVICYAAVTLSNMRSRVNEATETKKALEEQVEDIQEENAALQYAIDNQDDPDTIRDIAREKLGLVADEDMIFYDGGQ